MNCVFNKNGICEKLSDKTVKQPCIESPCNNDISIEEFNNAVFGYSIVKPKLSFKTCINEIYKKEKDDILKYARIYRRHNKNS